MEENKIENGLKQTKVCTKCGRELPTTAFYKCSSTKDGLQYHCKECYNRYQNEHRKLKRGAHKLDKVYTLPELATFTPRQLMMELKARGFIWDYMLEPQRKINFDKI